MFLLIILGVPFALVGIVTRWAQRRAGTVPESMGWVGLIGSLLGALAVPASGFWLVVGLSAYGIVVARQDAARLVPAAVRLSPAAVRSSPARARSSARRSSPTAPARSHEISPR